MDLTYRQKKDSSGKARGSSVKSFSTEEFNRMQDTGSGGGKATRRKPSK